MKNLSSGFPTKSHLDPHSSYSLKGRGYTALRERLRTHVVFTNDQCFYLNYHKFSIKSYVLAVY